MMSLDRLSSREGEGSAPLLLRVVLVWNRMLTNKEKTAPHYSSWQASEPYVQQGRSLTFASKLELPEDVVPASVRDGMSCATQLVWLTPKID
jgi:hypothetical protein